MISFNSLWLEFLFNRITSVLVRLTCSGPVLGVLSEVSAVQLHLGPKLGEDVVSLVLHLRLVRHLHQDLPHQHHLPITLHLDNSTLQYGIFTYSLLKGEQS